MQSVEPRAPAVDAKDLVFAEGRAAGAGRRYEDLFDVAPDGYLVTDEATEILAANRAAGELFGCEPGTLAGETLLGLVRPGQSARVIALREAARAEGAATVMDELVELRGDRPITVLLRCRAVTDPERDAIQLCWILHDLTRPLEAERAARRTQEAQAAHFRDKAEHLARLEAAKSDFLNLASHELRSPLTVLAGYISMLEDGSFGELSPSVRHVIELLGSKTREVNGLVNDMLETARLEDDRTQLSVVPLDVAAVVRDVVQDWRPLAAPGQQLELVEPVDTVCVAADPARLRTIVTNLVGNALKYSPGGGRVVCRVDSVADEARISVRDSGLGIAPESMDVLFTRFGRVVTPETSRLPGTGLGLYIARELTRMHGGDISVESQVGRGSEFTIALPLVAATSVG